MMTDPKRRDADSRGPDRRDPDRRARDRLAMLLGLRAGGGVLIAIGLWMLLGGSFAGAYGFGWVLLVVGVVEMLIVPKLLARAWRTPR